MLKAVILLARKQIHKYTDEQSRTFFFGWCLLCGGMFLGVFFGTHRKRIRGCADTHPFLAGDEQSHCGSRRRSRLVLPSQVSKLSRGCLRRSVMPPKVADARRGRGSVAVGSTHPPRLPPPRKSPPLRVEKSPPLLLVNLLCGSPSLWRARGLRRSCLPSRMSLLRYLSSYHVVQKNRPRTRPPGC